MLRPAFCVADPRMKGWESLFTEDEAEAKEYASRISQDLIDTGNKWANVGAYARPVWIVTHNGQEFTTPRGEGQKPEDVRF